MKQQGFTLLELMMVIVIIGILAAIAIPSYQRYINRSRVAEAALLTEPAQVSITEYAMLHNGQLDQITPSKLGIDSTQLTQGARNVQTISISPISATQVDINVTLNNALGQLTWTGIYQPNTSRITWQCHYAADNPVAKYAPHGCQANG